MKDNKKWFSIILAMWIVIIISLIAYNILEYVIPFWREVKWAENSSRSYYLANSWIEEWLYYLKTRTGSNERNENINNTTFPVGSNTGLKYNTYSSWNILPPLWEWNSNYDDDDKNNIINHDRNTISQWNPIQLSIGNWYITDLNNFKIAFKTPSLDYDFTTPETISGDLLPPFTPLVNWQLSSNNNSLNASWWIITNKDILDSNKEYINLALPLKDLKWTDLNWTDNISIWSFYSTNCWAGSGCILKFSVVNKLELDSNNVWVPYLEWQMRVNDNIPLRYTKIESAWKSIWYKRELEIKVPTKTVNQAFDFTIFQ